MAESGTSASSPAFAAMVTLINGERLAKNKSPLGFLNPALYALADSNAGVFNDITVGENYCAAGHGEVVCCKEGFDSVKGWDPVTGLGSVDFGKLKKVLAAW